MPPARRASRSAAAGFRADSCDHVLAQRAPQLLDGVPDGIGDGDALREAALALGARTVAGDQHGLEALLGRRRPESPPHGCTSASVVVSATPISPRPAHSSTYGARRPRWFALCTAAAATPCSLARRTSAVTAASPTHGPSPRRPSTTREVGETQS